MHDLKTKYMYMEFHNVQKQHAVMIEVAGSLPLFSLLVSPSAVGVNSVEVLALCTNGVK